MKRCLFCGKEKVSDEKEIEVCDECDKKYSPQTIEEFFELIKSKSDKNKIKEKKIGTEIVEYAEKSMIGKGIKISYKKDGKEIARAYLYILKNDLHKQPFGLLEDVYVDETYRGKGFGKEIVRDIIKKAKECGCYKLICTSRYQKPEVHEFYKKLGFKEWGKEFRIDFEGK